MSRLYAELYIGEVRASRADGNGRMFIPVEDLDGSGQHIWVVDKAENGDVTKKKLYGVRYVPLTDAPR